MRDEKEVLEYDEDDSIKFIRSQLPLEMQGEFTDDDINYIVDLIYEFYEDSGFLNEDDDSDIAIDEDEVLEYVIRNARKDAVREYTEDQIALIVAGEFAYCDSLNIFE